jgi:DNA-binding response OmpR family regulator
LDGEEAVRLAKSGNHDLILLDILLPKVDGYEVLRQLKAAPETKNVPVIVLSNLGSENDIKKSKELGAKNHFVKVTMDPRKIVSYVKSYLEGPKKNS